MNGGSTTQTQTQNSVSEPWKPAQPALQNLLGKATYLVDNNVGAGVYGGDRTAGIGTQTKSGFGAMRDGAMAGAPTASAANGFVRTLTNNGGTTAGTRQATAGLASVDPSVDTSGVASAAARLASPNGVAARTGNALADGKFATDARALTGLAKQFATGTTQTQRSLQGVADGAYLGGANPYLDDIIDRSAGEAASAVGQKFAASGRYGSGRFAAATADAVDKVGTELRYTDYDNERARQASAASAIDAAGNARAGVAGNLFGQVAGINTGNANIAATGAGIAQGTLRDALTGATSLYDARAGNANRELTQRSALLSGAQSDRQAGLAGVAALPTVQAGLVQPGTVMAGIGAVQDEARQKDIDAAKARFDETQQAPWKPLGLASSITMPIASSGGTSSGTSQTRIPQPSPLQQLLGFGLAGAGVASKFI